MQQSPTDHWLSDHRILYPDLLGACSLTVVLGLGLLFAPVDRVVRTLLGLPVLLFLPGYVFVMALFPRRNTASPNRLETGGLSVVSSLSILLAVCFPLNYTQWGITAQSVISAVCGVTVLVGVVATLRRSNQSAPDQLSLSGSPLGVSVSEIPTQASRRDLLFGGFTGLSLSLGAATALSAYVAPRRGETYTEFHILSETEDGTLTAGDYPTELLADEPHSLVSTITNSEQESTAYEVVVELQDRTQQGGTAVVLDREELSRYETVLDAGETDRTQLTLSPTLTGSQLRLNFSLYLDEAPAVPSPESAYRTVHLWVDVAETAEAF